MKVRVRDVPGLADPHQACAGQYAEGAFSDLGGDPGAEQGGRQEPPLDLGIAGVNVDAEFTGIAPAQGDDHAAGQPGTPGCWLCAAGTARCGHVTSLTRPPSLGERQRSRGSPTGGIAGSTVLRAVPGHGSDHAPRTRLKLTVRHPPGLGGCGVDSGHIAHVVGEIVSVHDLGVLMAVVVGGAGQPDHMLQGIARPAADGWILAGPGSWQAVAGPPGPALALLVMPGPRQRVLVPAYHGRRPS